jgi:hypothetical protein
MTSSMKTEVMHEDLGLSIAEEGNMAVYAGELLRFKTYVSRMN